MSDDEIRNAREHGQIQADLKNLKDEISKLSNEFKVFAATVYEKINCLSIGTVKNSSRVQVIWGVGTMVVSAVIALIVARLLK